MMKKIMFLFYFWKRLVQTGYDEDYECKVKILQFYGFEGLSIPIDYTTLVGEMNNDYCPSIKYSCCTRQDYSKL